MTFKIVAAYFSVDRPTSTRMVISGEENRCLLSEQKSGLCMHTHFQKWLRFMRQDNVHACLGQKVCICICISAFVFLFCIYKILILNVQRSMPPRKDLELVKDDTVPIFTVLGVEAVGNLQTMLNATTCIFQPCTFVRFVLVTLHTKHHLFTTLRQLNCSKFNWSSPSSCFTAVEIQLMSDFPLLEGSFGYFCEAFRDKSTQYFTRKKQITIKPIYVYDC